MRVVVYAEGPLESREVGPMLRPGSDLEPTDFGPAHVLVQRALVEHLNFSAAELRFVVPLRVGVRRHRGSDLIVSSVLRRLLTWPRADERPDLAIVVVDEDGDAQRGTNITSACEAMALPTVVGVCRPEFEAWLMADVTAARDVLGAAPDEPPSAENMHGGDAKRLLAEWIAGRDDIETRLALARKIDLVALRRHRSFERFVKQLRAVLAR
jgi:hypothetical protein